MKKYNWKISLTSEGKWSILRTLELIDNITVFRHWGEAKKNLFTQIRIQYRKWNYIRLEVRDIKKREIIKREWWQKEKTTNEKWLQYRKERRTPRYEKMSNCCHAPISVMYRCDKCNGECELLGRKTASYGGVLNRNLSHCCKSTATTINICYKCKNKCNPIPRPSNPDSK
jgi:hypothetical protein